MNLGKIKVILNVQDPETFRQRLLSGQNVTFADVRIYPPMMETAIQEIYHWQRMTNQNSLIRIDSGKFLATKRGSFREYQNQIPGNGNFHPIREDNNQSLTFEEKIDLNAFIKDEELTAGNNLEDWKFVAKEYRIQLHTEYHQRNIPYRYTKPVFYLLTGIMIQSPIVDLKEEILFHQKRIRSHFDTRLCRTHSWALDDAYPKHLKEAMLKRPAPSDLNPPLNTTLRPYQQRSLKFCMDVEDGRTNLWIQLKEDVYYSPYLMQFSKEPKKCKGGFLCDEMGLGKTVVTLGLSLMHPNTNENQFHTLVVCPVSLVSQWIKEAKKHILNVEESDLYLHHGQRRYKQANQLATKKVVVTTYGVLTREWTNNGPLMGKRWNRVVFDECHILKNPNTQQYKAAKILQAEHKWYVTGTPGLELHDLKNALKVIDEQAFTNLRWFYRENVACPRYTILSQYMIRHRKDMRDEHGQPIVDLPNCDVADIVFDLSSEEWTAYESLRELTATRLPFMVGISAFRELQNLRRRLSGADTVPTNASQMQVIGEHEREIIEQRMDGDHCCICLDVYERPCVTECQHAFCLQCISNVIELNARCPMCRTSISSNSLRLIHPLAQDSSNVAYTTKLTRVQRLITEKDDGDKFLIFVQFDQSAKAIKQMLTDGGILYSELTSKMTQRARSRSLENFERSNTINVFVLSTRCGAVGINLTSANKVILYEPFMNPKVEKQAIGRAWRLGQQRDVKVYRMVSKNTIEEKIVRHLEEYNDNNRRNDGTEFTRREDNAPQNIWNFNTMNSLIAT